MRQATVDAMQVQSPDQGSGSREATIDAMLRRYGARGVGLQPARIRAVATRAAFVGALAGARCLKRTLDIVLSLLGMLALAPLFTVVAVIIKLTDRGPVLYWQTRVGQYGREFRFPKFRSMLVNADAMIARLKEQNQHAAGVTFKMRRDPRITPIGRIIRKLSIDELPQLWCVLVGQMSLVGPRPPLPREVAAYTLADRRRLDVRPGLTCIWQVSGRADIPFPEQVALDIAYIESQSFAVDLRLLLKTVPAVLFGHGAY